MKLLRLSKDMLGALLATLLAFSIISCDKDEEEEVSEMLSGTLACDMPIYAKVNTEIDLEAYGITEPEDAELKYLWVSETLFPDNDSIRGKTCTIVIPDTIMVHSMILTAYADGYYDRVLSLSLESIDTEFGRSITEMPRPTDSIQDPRDEQWYYITTIGNLDWFVENLNWMGAGQAYAKSDDLGEIMGRLYTWEDATGGVSATGLGAGPQGVCPPGWSVPTAEDWEDLALNLNDGEPVEFDSTWEGLGEKVMLTARFNGEKMWPYTPDCTPENKYGWAAFPAGNCMNDYNNYTGLFSYGFWWASTEYTSTKAYYRYLYKENRDFLRNVAGKSDLGASVRCVRIKQ